MPLEFVKDAEIAIICPLFNKFAYGRRMCLSALKYSARKILLIVVDDASPYYPKQDWDAWRKGIPPDRLLFKHFDDNGGLTRSWNFGLTMARDMGIKYCVCSNSDILFTPGWEESLIYHLERGYHMLGPVTNAPGMTNSGQQRVQNFYPGYELDDGPEYLAQVSNYLKGKFPINIVHGVVPINGFFMIACTETWWSGAFDGEHVFNPGKRMTGNEDELQRRWHKKKRKTGFTPSSFIFHYRAVSRGDRFKHKGWFRLEDINRPV